MRFLPALLLVLVLAFAPAPVLADATDRENPTVDLWSEIITIAAGASAISTVDISLAEIEGLDWYLTSAAAINIGVQVRNSNAYAGPYSYWTSINGTSSTTTFSITGTSPVYNGTDLRLFPSHWLEIKFVNNGAATITVRRATLYKY